MPSGSTLLVFAGATLLLLALPGPSVLYVVARTVEQGRAAGLVSVLGLETGALIHVGAAAAGVSALVASSPGAFAALRYGGAAYLLWLAARTLLRARGSSPVAAAPASRVQLFRDGVMVDLLNPKTALFFLAFLPQFVDPDRGAAAPQVLALGVLFLVLATLSDSSYALVAGSVRGWLGERRRTLARTSGFSYLGLGVLAALSPASNSSAHELMQ